MAVSPRKGMFIPKKSTFVRKNYTLNELVQILNKHLGKKIKPEYIENPMKDTYVYYTLADIKKDRGENRVQS